MPNVNSLKPQYESKKDSIIPSQKSKVDWKKEYAVLSKIIDENKKIEAVVRGSYDACY